MIKCDPLYEKGPNFSKKTALEEKKVKKKFPTLSPFLYSGSQILIENFSIFCSPSPRYQKIAYTSHFLHQPQNEPSKY